MSAQHVAPEVPASRVPVWLALSELYLDTDVSAFHADITRTLAASPYSLEALQAILFDEVHPALHTNLLQVAGEWAGFDEDWLLAHLHAVCARPLWRRRLSRLSLGLVRDDWHAIRAQIQALRDA
jgi:hypothetical protein